MRFVIGQKRFMGQVEPNIEVVYVPRGEAAFHTTHALYAGMTVLDALDVSQVFQAHPEARGFEVGVFARRVALDMVLMPGMRVEVYRPLQGGPKEKRRRRAKVR
jgi:uncharacterized protein